MQTEGYQRNYTAISHCSILLVKKAYRAIEADASERVAGDGVSIALAGLTIGKAVISGLTFAASAAVGEGSAGTLTRDGVAKIGPRAG